MLRIYQNLLVNVANTLIPFHQIILLHIKTMENSCVSCKNNTANKILLLEELNKID